MDPQDYFHSFLLPIIPFHLIPSPLHNTEIKCPQRHRDGGLLCPKGEAITGEPQYVLMVESIELKRG